MHKSTATHTPEYRAILHQFRVAGAAVVVAITVGAVFYHIVEKWSWLDAVYFCVVTLGTVGYGDIVPTTDAAKIFTMVYIVTGIGLIATFANLAIKRAVARHGKLGGPRP